jgi:hypothetical protein
MGSRSVAGILQLTGMPRNKPLLKPQCMDTNSLLLAHASNKLWIFARHGDILTFQLNRKALSWRQQSMMNSATRKHVRSHEQHNRDRYTKHHAGNRRYSSSRWGVTTFQKEFENLNILSNHETVTRQLRVEVRHGIDTYFNMNAGRTRVRILSKLISKRNLVRTPARRTDSVIGDTVWIGLGYGGYIKRVKESIISGESPFKAYMQTRIEEQKSSVRFDIYRDSSRIDEIHEPVQ